MSTDKRFEIPVTNGAYSGSDRAKMAQRQATDNGASMHTPMVGEGPNPTATQSDEKPMPANSNDNLKQDSKPRVLNTMTRPAKNATPPNIVNPNGLPGLHASKKGA